MIAAYVPMVAPALIKQFREDFEVARLSQETATLYLQFEDQHLSSSTGMKRTRRAAIDCGTALKRMHDTESWRDAHASWTSVCRALKIVRQNSYRLISMAQTLSTIPQDAQEAMGPLSGQQLGILAQADPDDAEATIAEAAEAGDANPAFAKLRELLKASATPQTEIDEGEAPKAKSVANDVAWVRRTATSLLKWFDGQGLAVESRGHIEALVELAESCID